MVIPAWAAEYVGIPYAAFGRTRDGADCWGLARLIWRERAGIELPEFPIDPRAGDQVEAAAKETVGDWTRVEPGSEAALDGALMMACFGEGRNVRRAAMHVGVVLGDGWLIHSASSTTNSCVVRYRPQLKSFPIVGFWRHKSRA